MRDDIQKRAAQIKMDASHSILPGKVAKQGGTRLSREETGNDINVHSRYNGNTCNDQGNVYKETPGPKKIQHTGPCVRM